MLRTSTLLAAVAAALLIAGCGGGGKDSSSSSKSTSATAAKPAGSTLSSREIGLRLATVQGCLQGSGYPKAKRDSNSSNPDFVSVDTADGTRVDVDVLPSEAEAKQETSIASSAAAGGGEAEQHGHAVVSTAGQLAAADRAKIASCADAAK